MNVHEGLIAGLRVGFPSRTTVRSGRCGGLPQEAILCFEVKRWQAWVLQDVESPFAPAQAWDCGLALYLQQAEMECIPPSWHLS